MGRGSHPTQSTCAFDPALPGGLPQGGETLVDFPNNHLGYALTWFGLAVALAGVFVAFVGKRMSPGRLNCLTQAWPASLASRPASMPMRPRARSYLLSRSVSKINSDEASAEEPAVLLDLILQLTRGPSRVAERQHGVFRSASGGYRLEDLQRRGQADVVVDGQGRILNEIVGAVQNKPACRFDRTAPVHAHVIGQFRQSDLLIVGNDVELDEEVAKRDLRCRLVDGDAHGAPSAEWAHR